MTSNRFLNAMILGALFLGAASSASAGGLTKKFKNWDRTPEAYFMTNAERAQYRKIQTDADAQNFILDYKAKRGPDFDKILNERVAAADKYFSSGETKGSETLRGRVVILFGPPTALENEKSNARRGLSQAPPGELMPGGKSDATAMSSGGASPMGSAPPHAQSPTITFVYDEESAPKAIGKKFKVEIRMISNSYQEAIDTKDLDEKAEAVARASIVAPG